MVDVVVNEGALCVGDRLFDRMQLLSEVQTRAPGFDHLDDAAEVAFRTSQPLHDIWVCGMERLICHTYILSWGRGYVKRHALHPRPRSSLLSRALKLAPPHAACTPRYPSVGPSPAVGVGGGSMATWVIRTRAICSTWRVP